MNTTTEDLKSKRRHLAQTCRHMAGHGYVHPADELERVADYIREEALRPDVYGSGAFLAEFESDVAALLGKPAARYMPSGCMAQPIALRIWADRASNKNVAFHATSHLELHEDHAYRELHGLKSHLLGDPTRPTLAADLEGLPALSSLLVELPAREIGGQLPTWEQLVELSKTARTKQIRMHLDGARLWQVPTHYGKSLVEVCDLFDSIYVSFYKDVGALSGAMLIGPADFIDEAAIWQRRQGGTLYSNMAHIVSAQMHLDEVLESMPRYHARAAAIAAIWSAHEGVSLTPAHPHTNMFHLHIEGDTEALLAARDQVAEEQGIWLFGNLRPLEGASAKTEVTIARAALELTDADLIAATRRLLELA